jgi:hypothetical protein
MNVAPPGACARTVRRVFGAGGPARAARTFTGQELGGPELAGPELAGLERRRRTG